MKTKKSTDKGSLVYSYFTYFEFILWTSSIIIGTTLSCIYSFLSSHIHDLYVVLACYVVFYLIGLECANNRVSIYNKGIYIKSPLRLMKCRYILFNDMTSVQLINARTHSAFAYRIKYIDNKHEKVVRFLAPSSLKSMKKLEETLAEYGFVVEECADRV